MGTDEIDIREMQLETQRFEARLADKREKAYCDLVLTKWFTENNSTSVTLYKEQLPGLIDLLQQAVFWLSLPEESLFTATEADDE